MDGNKIGTFMLDLRENPKISKYRNFELAATITNQAAVQGDALSTYELLPAIWAKKVVDAAKARHVYTQAFDQFTLAEGQNMLIIPKRKKYQSSWETSAAEYGVNTNITWTALGTTDGVQITPADASYGFELTNLAVRTNAIPMVAYCREELAYKMSDLIEDNVTTTLDDATAMSNTVWGMQTIFGGDATDANNNLDDGDVLTTSMINKAERLIESNVGYYWNSNAWTRSAVSKNPWELHDSPLYLYIAPEQKEALRNSGQFVNAAEYGGNEVVMNGEIGQYLGVKVLCTTKTPSVASAGTFTHQGSTCQVDTNVHTCFMLKSGVAGALVWGLKPRINAFDWPSGMKKRITLEMAYASAAVQPDAIVKLAVTDV